MGLRGASLLVGGWAALVGPESLSCSIYLGWAYFIILDSMHVSSISLFKLHFRKPNLERGNLLEFTSLNHFLFCIFVMKKIKLIYTVSEFTQHMLMR